MYVSLPNVIIWRYIQTLNVKWSQESQGVREKNWLCEADLIFLCLLVDFKYFYSLIM